MRTPLANVDASWLRMDEPTNPMVVTGVLMLETPVSVRRLRELLRRRLLRFDRFRQRIVRPFAGVGPPSWEEDPSFSLDWRSWKGAATITGALLAFAIGSTSTSSRPGR